jgi:hypothetical protein
MPVRDFFRVHHQGMIKPVNEVPVYEDILLRGLKIMLFRMVPGINLLKNVTMLPFNCIINMQASACGEGSYAG